MVGKNKNAFVIHHCEGQRSAIAEWLTEAGYVVDTYQTAREFLIDRDRHKAGGFVLTSLNLLDTSGLDLTGKLKEEPRFRVLLLATTQYSPAAAGSGQSFHSLAVRCKDADGGNGIPAGRRKVHPEGSRSQFPEADGPWNWRSSRWCWRD